MNFYVNFKEIDKIVEIFVYHNEIAHNLNDFGRKFGKNQFIRGKIGKMCLDAVY